MTLRDEGQTLPRDRAMALPVYAVKKRADAESLQIALCRRQYDGTYRLTWGGFTGKVAELPETTKYFDAYYREFCERAGRPYAPAWPGLPAEKGFAERVDEARKAFEKQLESLADEFRERELVPLCQKYGLKFLSGNGTFFFSRGETPRTWETFNTEEELRAFGEDLVAAGKVLDTEAIGGDYGSFGLWVKDVVPTARTTKAKSPKVRQ